MMVCMIPHMLHGSAGRSGIRSGATATVAAVLLLATVAGCGGDGDSSEPDGGVGTATAQAEASELAADPFATLSVAEADAVLADPPDDLVLLDVRTPEEFAEGHIEGAVMVDFYREDFAAQLAGLDPDVPYLVYCRSGNRSGQTLGIMEELGFSSAVDIGGGVVAWDGAGLPLVP